MEYRNEFLTLQFEKMAGELCVYTKIYIKKILTMVIFVYQIYET